MLVPDLVDIEHEAGAHSPGNPTKAPKSHLTRRNIVYVVLGVLLLAVAIIATAGGTGLINLRFDSFPGVCLSMRVRKVP